MSAESNSVATILFFVFVAVTLGITYFAATKTRSIRSFYAAGGRITAWQNGWALAGDFLSAAALLGIAGIVASDGFDGLVYSVGYMVGWPILLLLIAEPLRSVGRYTVGDVLAFRLQRSGLRPVAALGTLAVVICYLIAQMVATGSLVRLLFGMNYSFAVVLVGAAMLVYVMFGGMYATTWVQIVKAAMLMAGGAMLTCLVLGKFGWNPLTLFSAAAGRFGEKVLQPSGKLFPGGWDAISLGLGLMFGVAGMPHILMRIHTVPDVREARLSVVYAMGIIGAFHLMVFVIGFGAMLIVAPEAIRSAGSNIAAPLLALAVGGEAFFGFICAVAFATMLAVVAGLTISGVAALSHDMWSHMIRRGQASESEQLLVARCATVLVVALAVGLGIVFEGQNVAFLVGLAFAIACSANFPVLVLALGWRHLSTPGAMAGILVGTFVSLIMIVLSPTIQVDVLGHALADIGQQWWFVPIRNPAIVSMPLSFLAAVAVSLAKPDSDAEVNFIGMRRRITLGMAAGHGENT